MVLICYPLCVMPIAFVSFGFGFLINPLSTEFGWTVTQIAIIASFIRLEGGFLDPIGGFIIDRWGPRKIIIGGQFLIGLGLILTSQVTELWQFYAAVMITNAGSAVGSFFACRALVVRWFLRSRGRAMGFMTPAASAGQLLLPLVAFFITRLGWSDALLVMGISILMITVPLAFAVRDDPYTYGLLPDGDPPEETDTESSQPSEEETPTRITDQGIRWQAALRVHAFWMLGISTAIWSLYHGIVRLFLIPHMEGLGYTREEAGKFMLIFFLISIPGRIAAGWLADHISSKKLLTAVLISQSLGLIALAFSNSWLDLFLYALGYEWAVGGWLALQGIIIAQYFGVSNYATIIGLMMTMGVLGGFMGPVIGARIYDYTGSYQAAFILAAALALVALPFILSLRNNKQQL
jgi:sugar phosphate permease